MQNNSLRRLVRTLGGAHKRDGTLGRTLRWQNCKGPPWPRSHHEYAHSGESFVPPNCKGHQGLSRQSPTSRRIERRSAEEKQQELASKTTSHDLITDKSENTDEEELQLVNALNDLFEKLRDLQLIKDKMDIWVPSKALTERSWRHTREIGNLDRSEYAAFQNKCQWETCKALMGFLRERNYLSPLGNQPERQAFWKTIFKRQSLNCSRKPSPSR